MRSCFEDTYLDIYLMYRHLSVTLRHVLLVFYNICFLDINITAGGQREIAGFGNQSMAASLDSQCTWKICLPLSLIIHCVVRYASGSTSSTTSSAAQLPHPAAESAHLSRVQIYHAPQRGRSGETIPCASTSSPRSVNKKCSSRRPNSPPRPPHMSPVDASSRSFARSSGRTRALGPSGRRNAPVLGSLGELSLIDGL
jgi:hypothetical protein